MSEHKTNKSSWTDEQKQLYRERRNKGLRGQITEPNMHSTVKDEKGNNQRLPLGLLRGRGISSRFPRIDASKMQRQLRPYVSKDGSGR